MHVGSILLALAVLGGANTANAYRPVSRSGFLCLPAMSAGMLTSELPLHALVVQLLGTAALVAAGALDSTTGVVGLVLAVVSWIGLVGLHRAAQRSRFVLAEAVGIEPGAPAGWRAIAFPRRGARRRLCTTRGVAYGDDDRNRLDIWRRPDLPLDGRAPVLLQLPGGAWVMGRKEDQAGPLLTHLADLGWVCVAADYRLSPAATWPAHIVDVKRAISWVRANIADHGGDPGFIAVTGGSAGGHLAALAALTPGDRRYDAGLDPEDTRVQAAVPMYGLYDLTGTGRGTRQDTLDFLAKRVFKEDPAADPAAWEAASPICRVRSEAVPFLVVHGTNDGFLPVEQARAFAGALAEASDAEVRFAELPRTQHAFDFFSSVRVHHTVRTVAAFLERAHSVGS